MKYDRQGLLGSRSCNQHFLFTQTESRDADGCLDSEVDPVDLASELSDLLQTYPYMLTGDGSQQRIMDRLKHSGKFVAMVIKIDAGTHQQHPADEGHRNACRLAVADIIDRLGRAHKGFWGLIGRNCFGCFFPGREEAFGQKITAQIQAELAENRFETLSAGIAAYPFAGFEKYQILENAKKALAHAAFFGPRSVVVFDAVSLNISGDKLYQKGDVQGALQEFKRALTISPDNVNVHNSMGVCYAFLGDSQQALTWFQKTMALDPAEVLAVYNAGLTYLLLEDLQAALRYFIQADDMHDDIFEIPFEIGKLYLKLNAPKEARRYFERATSLRPEAAAGFRYLGQCYATEKRYPEAIDAYKKAIKQNPNDAFALSAMGCLMASEGENIEIATVFCRQSIEIEPDNSLYHYRLGKLYQQQERFEEALRAYRAAEQLGYDAGKAISALQSRLTAKAS